MSHSDEKMWYSKRSARLCTGISDSYAHNTILAAAHRKWEKKRFRAKPHSKCAVFQPHFRDSQLWADELGLVLDASGLNNDVFVDTICWKNRPIRPHSVILRGDLSVGPHGTPEAALHSVAKNMHSWSETETNAVHLNGVNSLNLDQTPALSNYDVKCEESRRLWPPNALVQILSYHNSADLKIFLKTTREIEQLVQGSTWGLRLCIGKNFLNDVSKHVLQLVDDAGKRDVVNNAIIQLGFICYDGLAAQKRRIGHVIEFLNGNRLFASEGLVRSMQIVLAIISVN